VSTAAPTVAPPHQIAPEAYVIPAYHRAPGAPFGVHMNSMVLRGAEPVLFDTSVAAYRDDWLAAVFSVVDPDDVRWVVVSHDDADHVGNLEAVMERCTDATMVSSWFLSERMGPGLSVPPGRQRWVGPGEALDVGDRELSFLRPPLYDSPTTRVVHDPVSGVLWGADLFATPVTEPCVDATALDVDDLASGMAQFQQWGSPWLELIDRDRFDGLVTDLAARDISTIASAHGPAYLGRPAVRMAFELLRAVPDTAVGPQPGQPVLDEIVEALSHA
jgi:flavorubredoxin